MISTSQGQQVIQTANGQQIIVQNMGQQQNQAVPLTATSDGLQQIQVGVFELFFHLWIFSMI